MLDSLATLNHLYERFNARDLDAVLAAMQPDVQWANGWEGGTLEGRDAVRDYWTRQWAVIEPTILPEHFTTDGLGRVVIDAKLFVKDKAGAVVARERVKHAYTFKDGLVQKMEILPV